jgi:hypothetical protein
VFGLDDRIAALGTGEVLLVVVGVAVLLGLRHATDPDHLTAVWTLVAGEDARSPKRAGRLGFAWGLGHATTLFAFGLPVVLFNAYLPQTVERAAEAAIGLVIVALALRLLVRWRRGHLRAEGERHDVPRPARSPLQAYAIGLVHGVGGSAGVGVLLLAAIPDRVVGAVALALFAACTGLSMTLASTSFGYTISRGPVMHRLGVLAPALGSLSLGFGAWYALGALHAVPAAV